MEPSDSVESLCERLRRSLAAADLDEARRTLDRLDALPVPSEASVAPGQRVGRFRLVSVLGRGGTASVHLAVDTDLGTPCAVKVLDRIDHDRRRRVLREARVLASIRHPNVLAMIELFEWRGLPVLVLEYVDGPSLADLLALRRPTPEQARALGTGIVLGVREAHRAGLVHRDVKPANVLVAQSGDMLLPKVGDFGLAKVVDPGRLGPASLTAKAFGTPAYMAPEQYRDPGRVDARADVFSLGCVLYELLAGRRAFQGRTVFELYSQVEHGEFVPLDRLDAAIPRDLVDAVHLCLRPDRDDRFADCDGLLDRWAGGGVPASSALCAPDLALGAEERADLDARARDAAHLDPERLVATGLTPVEEVHLERCARCRVQRVRLQELFRGIGPEG